MEKGESNIQKKFWKKSAFKVFLCVILVAIVLVPVGIYMGNLASPQNPEEISSMAIGDTVVSGMDVVDDNKIRKVPLFSQPTYIMEYVKDYQFDDIITALLTGVVKTPISQITSGSITRTGLAGDFKGPGMIEVNNDKLTIKLPESFIWGFKSPYMFAVKTDNGINIVENNKTTKMVNYDNINNDTVFHQYVSSKELKVWYNDSESGDKIAIDYELSNFSDGRNSVAPSEIKQLFGESTVEYMENYPAGNPVMVYMTNYKEVDAASSVSYLGSYPEYGDNKRAFNARAFSKAWDGTIIPPNTISSGKENVQFTSSRDPKAPGGYASHGSCPPARALRAIVNDAGFPLPRGMTWEHDAVLFGFNPATGIKLDNTGNSTVKIVMWTTGSNANTKIYAKLVKLVPN